MNSFWLRRFLLVLHCLSLLLFGAVSTLNVRGQDPGGYDTDCGNSDDDDNDDDNCSGCQGGDEEENDNPEQSDSDTGGDDDADDCDATGANPIRPYKANVHRQVSDIRTFGPAPILFTRHANSRTANFNDSYWELGYRQIWQHNWNYEMRNQSSISTQYILLRYPNGNEYDFKPLSYPVTVGSQLVPKAWNGDRLYVTALSTQGAISACTIVTASGEELDFQRSTAPAFHLIQKRNGLGDSWTCSYSSNTSSGRLTRITNNFGRWIQLDRETGTDGVLRINQVSTSDGRVVTYNYSAWASSGKFVLDSVNYPGGEQANYMHITSDPSSSTARPLLSTANDPAYGHGRPGAHIEYVYNYNASYPSSFGLVSGTLLEERNGLTHQPIIQFPLGSGPYPQILEGDGTEVTRKYTHGRLTTKRDGAGRNIIFARDSDGFGFVTSKTDDRGALTQYVRDYAGRILTRTDALGHARSHTYNAKGLMLTKTDELNHTITWTRDSQSRRTRKDYPDGSYEAWPLYNENSQPLTHQLRNGGTEYFTYDSLGNKMTHTDALGQVTNYTYYSNGLVNTMTDARLNTSTYTYNWRGQPLTITHPDNTAITYHYDDFGNRDSVTDELGHTTGYTFDEYNRVKTVTDPLSRTTTYEYGRAPGCNSCSYAGTLTRVTSPGGRITTYSYDGGGLRTCETVGAETADAATTTYTYDNAGNRDTMTDPRGKIWHYGYDDKHRKITATDPLGNTTLWSYDEHGNKLTETRPDGGIIQFVYDTRNRLTQTTDPAGHVTEMTYNETDNLLTLKDARNNIYTFGYDLLKRKTSLTYPDNSQEIYSYDAVGNLATYTTRAGQVKTSTYDNRNREMDYTWSDDTPGVSKTYDAAGRLLTMNNSVSALTYAYDDANEVTSETQSVTGAPAPAVVGYTYEPDGKRASLIYPDGHSVAYAYTARHQVGALSIDGASPLASYGYDLNSNMTGKTLENGTNATFVYDDASRLLTVDQQKAGASFAGFDYAYNSVNNRISRTETGAAFPSQTDSYGYDAIDQLTQVKYNFDSGTNTQDRQVDYDYDPVGNRTSVTDNGSAVAYTTNNLNEYSAKGATSLTYDANGNLTGNPPWTNTFDAQNRLVSTSSTSGGSISIAYDARNRPVKRVGGTALLPASAVSRKTHGAAGDFDINLPLTGAAGIECRSGGANNAHQLIVTFPRAITFVGASVTTGTGTVASTSTSPDGKQLTINLTNVTNAQTIVVTLTGVTDGTIMNDVIVGMGVLFSDVSGNGIVSNSDVAQCQGQVGGTVSASNFRSDVNVNGIVSNTDVSLIRSQVGGGLPGSPPLSQTPPTLYFAYDGWNLIEEHSAAGSELARYVHGVRTDELLARTTTAGTFYYHHDALGSTTAVTDATGNVFERYRYDIYGAPTFEDGNGNTIPSSTSGNRFLFTGREYLVELGLYDYRNRIYSPSFGRFLQADPLRFDGKDTNLYRYVFNNPVMHSDPSGLYCRWEQDYNSNGEYVWGWYYHSNYDPPDKPEMAYRCKGACQEYVRNRVTYDASTCGSCDESGMEHPDEACVQYHLSQYDSLVQTEGCNSLP